ncbi:hypothetical protein [Euzebya sp.]|uniref:hypothetical protein n=1 Tax=Euzebya sp. TaxID=1971409 RepID=UPI003510EE15
MTDASWLAALDHGLQARGVTAAHRAAVVVETEGFLAHVDEPALAHFGPPASYAASSVDALGGGRRRAVPDGVPVIRASGVGKRFGSVPVLTDVAVEVRTGRLRPPARRDR